MKRKGGWELNKFDGEEGMMEKVNPKERKESGKLVFD